MKKTWLLVAFAVVGILMMGSGQAASIRPAILGGAYDELLPDAVKGKPFVPSIKVRWEYDDNIYTTTDLEKSKGFSDEESGKLYVEPKLDLHWLTDTTYFGASYQYSLIWYENRADDDTDMAHDALLDIRHRFSPGFEVAVRDLFRYREEPEIAEDIVTAGGTIHLPYQRNGDYYYNRASVAGNLQLSRQMWANLSYANLLIDYGEDTVKADGTHGASYYYDRMVHTIAGKLQYLATPESKINLGLTYGDIDYDADSLSKDADAWTGYVGLDQSLTKNAVASISAGWDYRDYTDAGVSEDSPYVNVSLSSGLGKKGNGTVGYRYGLTETSHQQFGGEEAHTIYAGLNTWLATWTSVHFNTSYEMASFEAMIPGRSTSQRDEDAWLLGVVLRQHVHRDMYLEAGYRRTDVNSDYDGSTYDRNRYYLGFGGIF